MTEKERIREKLELWEAFQKNPAWQQVKEVIEQQVDTRIGTIIMGVSADQREQDFARGEVAGMKMIPIIVASIVEELTTDLDNLSKEN